MPAHKMVTIDGIRVRAEDETRYRARTGAPAGPLTRAHAQPSKAEQPEDPETPEAPEESEAAEGAAPQALFDPAEHAAPAVLEYLANADEAETARVLAAEAAGKNRKTIMGKDDSA